MGGGELCLPPTASWEGQFFLGLFGDLAGKNRSLRFHLPCGIGTVYPLQMVSPLRDAAGRVEDALHDDEVRLGTGMASEGSPDLTLQQAPLLNRLACATPTFFPRATRRLCTPERAQGTR